MVKLSEIANITKLAGFEFTKYMEYVEDGDMIAIRALNLKNGELVLDDVRKIYSSVSEMLPRSQLHKYDVVISYTGTIGECAQIREEGKYHLAPNVAKITPNVDLVDPNYLFQYLRSKAFKQQMLNYCGGSTQPTIPMKTIRELQVPLYGKEKERKIAAIFMDIDAKIANNKAINRNLSDQANALYKSWFVDFDPFNAEMPCDWKMGTVEDLAAEIVCGKTPSTKKEEYYGEDVPFVTIPDMHGCVYTVKTERWLSRLGAESQSKKTLPKNSICVSCIGTAGLVVLLSKDSQTNQQINSIIPKMDYSPYYIYLMMVTMSETINKLGQGGSTIVNLNKTQFGKMEVLIPSVSVMKNFDELVEPFFSAILSNQYENMKLVNLRDGLLPRLMSGELDVSELEL